MASLEERLSDGIDILLDETLHPGDLIVNAGQGGYYDLLEERIKNIQDQLRSVENTNSSEWLAESFREFLSSDNILDSESVIDSDSPEISIETDSYGSTIEDEGFSKINVFSSLIDISGLNVSFELRLETLNKNIRQI